MFHNRLPGSCGAAGGAHRCPRKETKMTCCVHKIIHVSPSLEPSCRERKDEGWERELSYFKRRKGRPYGGAGLLARGIILAVACPVKDA